jgi:hypothetical protein
MRCISCKRVVLYINLIQAPHCHCPSRFWVHLQAITFAAPTVVTVWSSVDEFQALALMLAARVLFLGTGWVAVALLIDLICLLMDLLGKRFLPMGSLAFFDFHTITHYCIWNQNVITSKFHKVNSYLGCSQFLRVPQKRFNVKSTP